ncbi:MAG: hypothetical protein JNJ54_21675 [Myxococcaceae bacterium]|nr:hypothetical protein [Myxococcaceae bacterium]
MGVRELKEKASVLVATGHYERAEVLLRQALLLSPRDAQSWLKHAEVLKRLSRGAAAAGSYRLAARLLEDEGHHTRSIAALKLALAELPDDVDIITDIIRSEMHARKSEAGVRSLFPVSSPSQLLSSVRASESGVFSTDTSRDVTPQLALPMASSLTLEEHEAQPGARARAATEREDTWVPEPISPPPSAPQFDTTGEGAPPPEPAPPRPSAPVRLEVESATQWPQVCRLSDARVAVKANPTARWVVVEASGPVTVRFEDSIEVPGNAEWLE